MALKAPEGREGVLRSPGDPLLEQCSSLNTIRKLLTHPGTIPSCQWPLQGIKGQDSCCCQLTDHLLKVVSVLPFLAALSLARDRSTGQLPPGHILQVQPPTHHPVLTHHTPCPSSNLTCPTYRTTCSVKYRDKYHMLSLICGI